MEDSTQLGTTANSGSRSALFVGAFVPGSQGTRGISEDIAIHLSSLGWSVLTTSRRAGKFERLADMLGTCWRERNRYEVAVVDVYSGLAFSWAEAACWTLRKLSKPYVLTLHGGLLPEFSATRKQRVRALLASAAAVTAPSQYLTEQMRSYRDDLLLIPNAVNTSAYPFRLRQRVAPHLVWLRAFHDVYNPSLAVQVVARLAQEFPEVRLLMIGPDKGDGSLQRARDEAEKLGVSGNIMFGGSVPKKKVSEKLSSADIFLNTSQVDNTPVSVMEAMACGLCIVSTNVGGIPYLLDNERDSLLVPAGDPDVMAQAVRKILTEPALAAALSENARRNIERFDWATITPRWDGLLQSIVNRSDRPKSRTGAESGTAASASDSSPVVLEHRNLRDIPVSAHRRNQVHSS